MYAFVLFLYRIRSALYCFVLNAKTFSLKFGTAEAKVVLISPPTLAEMPEKGTPQINTQLLRWFEASI